MNKNKLIDNLNKTYCRIMPSKLDGVGVFAIIDIPKDINPFEHVTTKCGHNKNIKVHKDELVGLHKNVIKMLNDYLKIDEKGYYEIPANGLNSLDISYYINNSDKPNMNITFDKDCNFAIFKSNKLIKKGTELLINYDDY